MMWRETELCESDGNPEPYNLNDCEMSVYHPFAVFVFVLSLLWFLISVGYDTTVSALFDQYVCIILYLTTGRQLS